MIIYINNIIYNIIYCHKVTIPFYANSNGYTNHNKHENYGETGAGAGSGAPTYIHTVCHVTFSSHRFILPLPLFLSFVRSVDSRWLPFRGVFCTKLSSHYDASCVRRLRLWLIDGAPDSAKLSWAKLCCKQKLMRCQPVAICVTNQWQCNAKKDLI